MKDVPGTFSDFLHSRIPKGILVEEILGIATLNEARSETRVLGPPHVIYLKSSELHSALLPMRIDKWL